MKAGDIERVFIDLELRDIVRVTPDSNDMSRLVERHELMHMKRMERRVRKD